jgi:predicted PurR-regulated permease PerM
MIYALLILAFISTIFLVVSVIFILKCLQLQEKLETLADDVEESLDLIDKSYKSMSNVLNNDYVAVDDPIIKSFIEDIKTVHNMLLKIANKLIQFDKTDEQ